MVTYEFGPCGPRRHLGVSDIPQEAQACTTRKELKICGTEESVDAQAEGNVMHARTLCDEGP